MMHVLSIVNVFLSRLLCQQLSIDFRRFGVKPNLQAGR